MAGMFPIERKCLCSSKFKDGLIALNEDLENNKQTKDLTH
jgi:hypothetical protein